MKWIYESFLSLLICCYRMQGSVQQMQLLIIRTNVDVTGDSIILNTSNNNKSTLTQNCDA